jgi:hypothetical protein
MQDGTNDAGSHERRQPKRRRTERYDEPKPSSDERSGCAIFPEEEEEGVEEEREFEYSPDPAASCVTCHEPDIVAVEGYVGTGGGRSHRECWKCKRPFCFDRLESKNLYSSLIADGDGANDACGSYYADENDFLCHPCCIKKMKREARTLKRKATELKNRTVKRRSLAKRRRLVPPPVSASASTSASASAPTFASARFPTKTLRVVDVVVKNGRVVDVVVI